MDESYTNQILAGTNMMSETNNLNQINEDDDSQSKIHQTDMTGRKTDPLRGTNSNFSEMNKTGLKFKDDATGDSVDSKNATFHQSKKEEEEPGKNQPERVGELSTIKSESRDYSSKASGVKFDNSFSGDSKDYLKSIQKLPDTKDSGQFEPVDIHSKENKPIMNVISENDGERVATAEFFKSENQEEKNNKINSINSNKSLNNNKVSNSKIKIQESHQSQNHNLLSPTTKKSSINSDLKSPDQSSIKKVSNTSTIQKSIHEQKDTKYKEKSKSPENNN